MIKDKFTLAELAEFTIGAFLSLFLGYSAVEKMSTVVTPIQGVLVLTISLLCCVGILYLRKMEKLLLRCLTAFSISVIIAFVFYVLILQIKITDPELVMHFLIGVSSSTIGALTVDILKED